MATSSSATPNLGIKNEELQMPHGIAVISGYIFVTDSKTQRLYLMDMAGNILKSKSSAFGKKFDGIAGVEASEDGRVYVADSNNSRVVLLSSNFTDLVEIKQAGGIDLLSPVDVALSPTGRLYVLDSLLRKVFVLSIFGEYRNDFCSPGNGEGQIASPRSIAAFDGRVAIADLGNAKAKLFTDVGREIESLGMPGTYPSSLSAPIGIEFDSLGNLYVLDKNNSDVVIFPQNGLEPISWGRFGKLGTTVSYYYSDVIKDDDFTVSDVLANPSSLTIFGDCLYIADTGNKRIATVSLEEVWRVPRVNQRYFQKQDTDIGLVDLTPEIVDFGSVSRDASKTVSLSSLTGEMLQGFARVVNASGVTVEPTVFVGSDITFTIKVNKASKSSSIRGKLEIHANNQLYTVDVSGTRTPSKNFIFGDKSSRKAILNKNGAFVTLFIEPQNGFAGKVRLKAEKPQYKPAWARYVTDKETLVLSTVNTAFDSEEIILDSEKPVTLNLYPVGKLKSGLFKLKVSAESVDDPNKKTEHTLSIYIASRVTGETQGTVVFETFTAHWCDTCGFHREAQYRLVDEFGRRRILPVAYHVLDDEDETGMTTAGNFSRFQMYDGQGVPLSVMNGAVLKVTRPDDQSTKYAADRIQGRKYSGTTFEYWKLRSEMDSAAKSNPAVLYLSVEMRDDLSGGHIWLKADQDSIPRDKELEAVLLLVQDGIEYFSANGESQHHAVVKHIIEPDGDDIGTSISKDKSVIDFEFSIPSFPEGFELLPDNSYVLAFLQDSNSKRVYGSVWYNLGLEKKCSLELYAGDGNRIIQPGRQLRIDVYVSNTGTCVQHINLSANTNKDIVIKLMNQDFDVAPGQTVSVPMYLTTKTYFDSDDEVVINLMATDQDGATTIESLFLETP